MNSNVVTILSKQSKVSENKIYELIEEISYSLIREGCNTSNLKFNEYLVRRLRKRLKIEDSKTYKTFKEFFKE